MKKGIDVSYAQGIVDWEAVKNFGIDFAILRAGYGMGHVDSQFARNAAECNRLGIPVGVYWFGYALSAAEAAQEAQKCAEAIRAYKITYPVCYDYEYDSVRYAKNKGVSVGKTQATALARAFLDAIKAAGYIPGLYSNCDYAKNMFDLAQLPYDLWYAWYNSSCNRSDAQMWQYSSKGKVNGIPGNVDLDYALKDYADPAVPTNSSTQEENTVKTFNATVSYLQQGDSGKTVEAIQRVMYSEGLAGADGKELAVDGSWGDNTDFAFRQWQKDEFPGQDNEHDGVFGPDCCKAMFGI